MPLDILHNLVSPTGNHIEIPAPPAQACAPGEFIFAATSLEHAHIYGMSQALCKAGATLKWVYDHDPQKQDKLLALHPGARPARSLDEILDDDDVRLVAAADVPAQRGDLGIRVMNAGKDYFTDKTPFTTFEQLTRVREAVKTTGRKFLVSYSERLNSESAILAGMLIEQGLIGRVLHVVGLGPHRLGDPASRPDWFYQKARYGGILCDIGSHQCEQFLSFTRAKTATVNFARVANFGHPHYPELEDFGEASITAENGASFYFRVDWFTPDGLRTWGDGRTIILGTEGTIELRKNIDIATENGGEQLYLFDRQREVHINARGTVGLPYFPALIHDCLHRTETAMTQEHAFTAAELCLQLQATADATK